MNRFSIADLQQFSGIKAHTIRIWEQRYDALKPSRSRGNTRYYDGHQLKRLLNIVSLIGGEEKISALCRLSDAELEKRLAEKFKNNPSSLKPDAYFLNQFTEAALSFNEKKFNVLYQHYARHHSIKDVYVRQLYPMLMRLGELWQENAVRPAHEHFITSLIRQKLMSAIDELPVPDVEAPRWLLFLPEGEWHENGLLLAQYIIRHAGQQVIYLGADVPMENLGAVIQTAQPDHLLYFSVRRREFDEEKQIYEQILKMSPKAEVSCACQTDLTLQNKRNARFRFIHSVSDLEALLVASHSRQKLNTNN